MKRLFTITIIIAVVLSLNFKVLAIEASTEVTIYEGTTVLNQNAEFLTFIPQNEDNLQPVTLHLPLVGMSTLVQFDDSYDTANVSYESSNTNIVMAYDGRILATGVGSAMVTINCGNFTQYVNVDVDDEISFDQITQEPSSTTTMTIAESSQRDTFVERGRAMANYLWTPSQTLTGWKGNYVFYANQVYGGIPYSQTYFQCDLDQFAASLSASDFYDTYKISGNLMPKYGNDCSAFVAVCWGLPHRATASQSRYTTYTFLQEYSAISGGYTSLEKGDAVVNSGHMFLISQNILEPSSSSPYSTPYVVAYEQTPGRAMLTFWTHDQLSNDGYRPISYFE